MDELSGDEFLFLILSLAATAIGCIFYYISILRIVSFSPTAGRRTVLGLVPLIAVIPSWFILNHWADQDVVGHPNYIFLFMSGAGAWIFIGASCLPTLGISIRDDALERNNPAAGVAACGLLLAIGITYGFSNVGSGPTIWTTIFPALVATILLFSLLLVAEFAGDGIADSIAIERDVSSGIRLGGAAIAMAMILGWAAAGDWTSWNQTWIDMLIHGWPALPLAFAAAQTHRKLRPNLEDPRPDPLRTGVFPASLFIVSAIVAIILL